MTATKRLPWIDATKGLLILLMVMGHIQNNAGNQGIDNLFLVKCMSFSSLYTCFFMQAFIILTGYTSNFEKEFTVFFTSLFKSIVIPWISFSIICQIFRVLNGDDSLFVTINNQRFFFLIEDFWFLHVLFFGKLLYYFIYQYVKSDLLRAIILLAMVFLGFTIFAIYKDTGDTYHFYNYLHYKDFLCMTFFIWFGNFCRRKDILRLINGRKLLLLISLFFLGHLLRLFFRIRGIDELLIAPVILSHGGNAISPLQVPAYLYYVIIGSLSCFGIMKCVKKGKLLEYFGRNSLIIYCMHFLFLGITVKLAGFIVSPNNVINAIIFIAISLSLVLLSCSAVIYITRFKPFNYLIGKF